MWYFDTINIRKH